MSGLLPSTPDTSAAEDAEPRVVGLDSEDADELIAALSSETARELLSALHEEPANPSALADRVDTSLQNAQYHLEKLENAEIVEVIDTAYSEKGREMNVYAPTDKPLVVFAGGADQSAGIRTALRQLLGGVGILALASLAIQTALEGSPIDFPTLLGGDDAEEAEPTYAEEPDDTVEEEPPADDAPADEEPDDADEPVADDDAAEEFMLTDGPEDVLIELPLLGEVTGIPPGVLFFAGGAVVLCTSFLVWYLRVQRV